MRITRITLKSFLVSLLGILTAEVDFSNGQQTGSYDHRLCYNITGGEEICYFFVTNGEPNWNRSHEKCQNKNSSLPIIRNREEQTAIEEYFKHLKSQGRSISAVWTSGKRKIYNDWTWINNNQTLNTTVRIINSDSAKSAEETHMTISNEQHTGADNILKTVNPVHSTWYLCQYKDRHCNGQQHEVNATNGCLIPSEYGNVSWYGARNECLSNGGDLAVLTHQDLQNLKNHRFPYSQYWIGLRKADWVWITSNKRKASTQEEEVKYTKWARQAMPTQEDFCISIWENDGQWKASDCNNALSVVCEQRGKTRPSTTISSTSRSSSKHSTTTQTTASTGNFPSTTTTTTTTTTTPITTSMIKHNDISSIPYSVPTRTDSNSTKSTTADNNVSSMTVPIAVGAGAVIVILCIIVILVVIRRKSKSSKNKTEPAQMDSETTKVKKPKEENPSAATATEERSIYADIPLTERTANDTPAGQKGTVYASLDFNEGVTYAEPSKLYTNTQNLSGPIYAEPLDANGNGTTSAGCSPTVKIGPMGDVYALPTTNVAPSSAKMTERPIYANT